MRLIDIYTTIFVLILSLIEVWGQEKSVCFGETEFVAVDISRNFDDSQQDCLNRNGNLASITSQEETDVVLALTTSLFGATTGFWIGNIIRFICYNLFSLYRRKRKHTENERF